MIGYKVSLQRKGLLGKYLIIGYCNTSDNHSVSTDNMRHKLSKIQEKINDQQYFLAKTDELYQRIAKID